MLNTVKVLKQFEPIFKKAQEYVGKYFKEIKKDPSKGTVEIFGERYIMIRAASMSIDFFDTVSEMYKDRGEKKAFEITRQLLFDVAHAVGKQDAKEFSKKLGVKEPIEKLSTGPVHFSHAGWAFVDIFPESRPSPDENYYLIYDHPYSFESDAWMKVGRKSDFPVCVMNAGYSSGWCEESFGIKLVAAEILCKARGDKVCRFIMAPPSKIEDYIREYTKQEPNLAKRVTNYEIPGFFKTKQMEDALRENEEKFRSIFDFAKDGILVVDMESKKFLIGNKAICQMLGYSPEEISHLGIRDIHPEKDLPHIMDQFERQVKGEFSSARDLPVKRKDGSVFYADVNAGTIEINKKIYMTGFFHDTTERIKTEKQLSKACEELEKINKHLVGRELKMIEQKKEIAELKNRLGGND